MLVFFVTVCAPESLWLRERLDLGAYEINGLAIVESGSSPYC
jgi:hypothetical protein